MLQYLNNKLLENCFGKDFLKILNDMNKLKDENLRLKDEIKDLEKRLNNVIISKNEIYEKYINLIIQK
jgi:cell division septum initiation protein DivIVA